MIKMPLFVLRIAIALSSPSGNYGRCLRFSIAFVEVSKAGRTVSSSEVHSLTLLFSRPRVPRSTVVSFFPFISDGIEVYRGLGEQIERTGTEEEGGGFESSSSRKVVRRKRRERERAPQNCRFSVI
ncbi:hypothetical protein BDY24DRAFT_398634 [Mrakia frigida]|uniref:uncharacterized protein n=1 Tax=Mrakia frigida TaxID=29902 RepID=UPI003FCC021E